MRAIYILRRFVEGVGAILSCTVNAAFFGGSTYQPLSSRAHDDPKLARLRLVINTLFFWEDDHCAASRAFEVARARRLLALNG